MPEYGEWKHGKCNQTCPYCQRPCIIDSGKVWRSHQCADDHTW